MRYLWATASHRGRVRDNNEDSLHPTEDGVGEGPVVLMVADGMGGHVAGEVASQLAVNAAAATSGNPEDRVNAGNRAIVEETARQPELQGMGTTLTLVELGSDGVARFAHVGDSRAYLLRDGKLRQLTNDHTVASEYVAAGRLTPEEAVNHPHRHMITRALGLTRWIKIDTFELPLESDDRLLLCSDGLTDMASADEIEAALAVGGLDEAAWSLVEIANSAGGHDNVTVVVAGVDT